MDYASFSPAFSLSSFMALVPGTLSFEMLHSVEMTDKCLLSDEPPGEEEGKESMTPKDFLG